MQHGSIVVVVLPGDYGKPRPGLVLQADVANDLPSVVICPITTTVRTDGTYNMRLPIEPTGQNGLREPSQIMIDKISAVPRGRIGQVIGQIDEDLLVEATRLVAILLGII